MIFIIYKKHKILCIDKTILFLNELNLIVIRNFL